MANLNRAIALVRSLFRNDESKNLAVCKPRLLLAGKLDVRAATDILLAGSRPDSIHVQLAYPEPLLLPPRIQGALSELETNACHKTLPARNLRPIVVP